MARRGKPKGVEARLNALSPSERESVVTVHERMLSELIDVLPELRAAVKASSKSASTTLTVSLKPGKKGHIRARVGTRVRAPREELELDMHITDDNQLSLGFPPGYEDDGDGTEPDDELDADERLGDAHEIH